MKKDISKKLHIEEVDSEKYGKRLDLYVHHSCVDDDMDYVRVKITRETMLRLAVAILDMSQDWEDELNV